MTVPATLKINFRVRKKNFMPDKATRLERMSPKNRFVSAFHKCDGTSRRTSIGFCDSSLIAAARSDTANVRKMRKVNENQK